MKGTASGRNFAIRYITARNAFLEYVMHHTQATRADAERVLAYYLKHKLVRLGVSDGQFHVPHGVLLEPETLQHALTVA